MLRFDIINTLIKRHGYKKYLEIGTQADKCLREIECEYKVGVDPDPVIHYDENSDKFFRMTSDDFFAQNSETFDIIFVDGLHEDIQVRKDIGKSLKILNDGGCIVVHDCNPREYINQEYPMPHVGDWNGTVWRAWMAYRRRKDVSMFVVDADQGCGVIFKGTQEPFKPKRINFDEFKANRKQWLNLISEEEFNGQGG